MDWEALQSILGIKEKLSDGLSQELGEYHYDIFDPRLSYLRYLAVNFKYKLHRFLDKSNIPLWNIYLIIKYSDAKNRPYLKIYLTEDQRKRIEKVFSKKDTWMQKLGIFTQTNYAKDAKGLAHLVAYSSKNTQFTFTTWHKWYNSPAYKNYPNLGMEKEIYGVETYRDSTLVITCFKNIEIILVYKNVPSSKDLQTLYNNLNPQLENYYLHFWSALSEIMLYDQYLYENIWLFPPGDIKTLVREKEKVIKKVKRKIDSKFAYFRDNTLNQIRDEYPNKFREIENELKGDFRKYIEVFGILKGDKGSIPEFVQKKLKSLSVEDLPSNVEEIQNKSSEDFRVELNNILGREPENFNKMRRNFLNNKGPLWGDAHLTDLPEMALHNYIHSQNLEELLESFMTQIGIDPGPELSPLWESIWLHDIGMTKYLDELYFLKGNRQRRKSQIKPRKIRQEHPLEGVKKLELNKEFYEREFSLSDSDLQIIKLLIKFHSRKAALLKKWKNDYPERYFSAEELSEELINYCPKSFEEERENNEVPYYLFISVLRILDAVDIQKNRCSPFSRYRRILDYIINKPRSHNEWAKLLKEQPVHLLKHSSFVNIQFDKSEKCHIEVVYAPDFLVPPFIAIFAFSEAIKDVENELKELNSSPIIEQVTSELDFLNGNKDIKSLIRNKKFCLSYSLWGIDPPFFKEKEWTKFLQRANKLYNLLSKQIFKL